MHRDYVGCNEIFKCDNEKCCNSLMLYSYSTELDFSYWNIPQIECIFRNGIFSAKW